MSAGPIPHNNAQVIENERRKLSQRLDDVARLCEGTLPPSSFYNELLTRLIDSLDAIAGSVWVLNAGGNLQQQFQINMQQLGLENDDARQQHSMLLRYAVTHPRHLNLPPNSSLGPPKDGAVPPGNPTGAILLMVPIRQNEQVVGLIEVFQAPNRNPLAVQGFLQYMELMANLAGRYQRNQLIGQLAGQQQLWVQLEAFARAVHSSLNPVEVSFNVANEGRRLIECDRISVANRRGGHKTRIEAVSGCDTVEKRSNQIKLMRNLADAVLNWGERLVYSGLKDDSLPPKVLTALEGYLAETPSRLLVIQPLREEKDATEAQKDKDKPRPEPRSALVMECFESPPDMQQTMARLDVVARHATPALNNSIAHYRIPMRWVWAPLASLQEGLGGKTKAITLLVVAALSIIITGLVVLPYPLKVEATGNAQPAVLATVFTPVEAMIDRYAVKPDDEIPEGRALVLMDDSNLCTKHWSIEKERDAFLSQARGLDDLAKEGKDSSEKAEKKNQSELKRIEARFKDKELDELLTRVNGTRASPGRFTLRAPRMTPEERSKVNTPVWSILNSDFAQKTEEKKLVRPNEPIIRLGAKDGEWELQMKIPQKHIGQVLRAFTKLRKADKPLVLDVEFIMLGDATQKYAGKLEFAKIAGEVIPDTETTSGSEPEPVALAKVRLEGDDIPKSMRVPREQLLASSGIRAKILCGDHAAGYSLFYGVWEFLYEKVVFFLF